MSDYARHEEATRSNAEAARAHRASTLAIVKPILVKTYGAGSMTLALADHLAESIDNYIPRWKSQGSNRESMIRETCWNWMTGGTTAERVARDIEAAL
jgi:hypothetical protein